MGNAWKQERGVSIKPEAAIIGRITENNAPARTQRSYLVKSGFNEPNANPLPLLVRSYRNRPETVPIDGLSIDLDGREGNMTHDHTITFCDQGCCQSACPSQGVDNRSFSPVTMWRAFECDCDKRLNFWNVADGFRAYYHKRFVANDRWTANSKSASGDSVP